MTPDSSDFRDSLTEGVWWFGAAGGRRLRASLHFADGFVRAENEDGERRDARISDVRISSRLGNAPRKIVFADGVCISADDNDFVDAAIRIGGGSQKSFRLHKLESQWTAAAFVVLAAALFLLAFFEKGIPAAAEFAADQIPRAQLVNIGDEMYEQILAAKIVSDSELSPPKEKRVRDIFAEVSADISQEGDDFRLILHKFIPNAFALPGGRVVVSDSLAEFLSDDELAAVFAHEIGHVRRRHGMRAVLLGSTAALIIAVLSGDITGVSFGVILLNLGYSRDHEREADCFAYEYLRRNGMPPSLIGEALTKMESQIDGDVSSDDVSEDVAPSAAEEESEEESEGAAVFRRVLAGLSTHPPTEERYNLAAACEQPRAQDPY